MLLTPKNKSIFLTYLIEIVILSCLDRSAVIKRLIRVPEDFEEDNTRI
jgi:uncharacterized protein Smg (DUF494 family)